MATPRPTTIFNRPDTFFGVCEAIGQDFGINPLWVRLAFVPPIFFFPAQTMAAYLVLALIVLVSRKAYPSPAMAAPAVVSTVIVAPPVVAPVAAAEIDEPMVLPLAA